jgi:hypothetical protein
MNEIKKTENFVPEAHIALKELNKKTK